MRPAPSKEEGGSQLTGPTRCFVFPPPFHSHSQWQPYSNPKAGGGEPRGAPNVWFRHAHSCHVLIKPKRDRVQVSKPGTPSFLSTPCVIALDTKRLLIKS